MKTVATLLLMLSLPALLKAQTNTGTIQGQITNEQGEPLVGITVFLQELKKGTASDTAGVFHFNDIPKATYTIRFTGIGFETYEATIEVDSDRITKLDITLSENISEMEEIVVKAESEGAVIEKSAQAVEVVELSRENAKTADMGEVLSRSEGVSVQRAGGLGSNTRFALNGLSGDKIRFFYNGIPLNFTPYSFGIANIPVNVINRVEVYKGVVPIQFGADALGGAINLISPTIFDGWSGAASYQPGAFNTHRATANIAYANDSSGLFVSASGFFDHSDNDYQIDVAIPNEQGELQQESVPRFNAGYTAYGTNLQIGVRNKKWAKELSLEGYYGDSRKELQNPQSPGFIDIPSIGINKAVAGAPFGDIVTNDLSYGLNLSYKVNFSKKFKLNLKAGYNSNESIFDDTSRCLYNWHGECIRINNKPGELGNATKLVTNSENIFARQQVVYELSDKHTFKLSVSPTKSQRKGDDLFDDGPFDPARIDGSLLDVVTGIEYTADLMNDRLQSVIFVKNYFQDIRIEKFDPSVEDKIIDERSVSNYGAGTGLRYQLSSRFRIKASYEFAYRLPRQNEIFGNGQLILENLELRPENSHNVNLQLILNSSDDASSNWQLKSNFFTRNINDLIFLVLDDDNRGFYDNVWSATSQGIEFSGKWEFKEFKITANTTYQNFFNTSDEGPFAEFKGNRLPNLPYLFSNGKAEYDLPKLFNKKDRLTFFWNTRYVHSFLIGWEDLGLESSKLEVPGQLIHNSGVTYELPRQNLPFSVTFEVQNLANTKVFDFFGVQRPGRAFSAKLTTQF